MRLFRRLGIVLLLGLALLAPVGHSQAAAPPGPGAQGRDWQIEPVAGGYRVTLKLAEPVPLRAALPLLAINGKSVGVAQESTDRRTLTLVTQDPVAATARDVNLVWSTEVGKGSQGRTVAGPSTDAEWLRRPTPPLNKVDPGAVGKYSVEATEYNLGDQAIYLPDLGERSELRARVYTPRGAVGRRPLVVFLHGRHSVCYGEPTLPPGGPEKPWPCPSGTKPIPSYKGYDSPAWALASHGYQVVSISANAINAYDSRAYDAGAMARAQLVLAHLDLWKRWSTTGGGPFGRKYVGKVDLNNIGLMGHSRGGEGVARAAVLNSQLGGRYGIRAVLPLAPTDFARFTVPGVAMSVLLPYCDGDVADLQGQKFFDDTRYAVDGDRAARSTVLVLGTNHNFFNTQWTPGQSVAPSWDDWFDENPKSSPCGAKYTGRLSAAEQQAVGRAYVAGFFRLELGREQALLPIFDGSNTRSATAGRAVVRVASQAPADQRLDVARFDQALPASSVSGSATTNVCAGVASTASACVKSGEWKMPHWVTAAFAQTAPTTAVTKLRWTGKSGVVRVNLPPGQRDVRTYSALTFRAAPDPSGAPRTDLTLRVVDGRGQSVNVPVSAISDALLRLPGSDEYVMPKTLLRTVRLPLWWLAKLDKRDIRTVELRTDRVASGSVFVSDLAFATAGIGKSGPVRLPSLSASDATVVEGDTGTANLDFWVTMSRPSRVPVSLWVETHSQSGFNEVTTDVKRRLVFKPGQTRQKVTLPFKANTRDSYDVESTLVLSLPKQAIVGDSFGQGTVLDDDPTPTLTTGNAVGYERSKIIKFPLRLSAPSDKFIFVSATLRSGTALVGPDVRGFEAPPYNFAYGEVSPGQTVGWLTAILVDDKVREPTEKFTVRFDEVREEEAVFRGPQIVSGSIVDND